MKEHLKSHIGYWINRLRMYVHQALEQRLSQYGISVAQWCILVALYDQQATSVVDLSRYIEIDKAAISRVVGHLIAADLVDQTAGKDRRSGHLQLTDDGRQLVPLLIKEAEKNEEVIFGDLTPEERGQLQFLLKKLLIKNPAITLDGWIVEKGAHSQLFHTKQIY
jgi:DNA-binding MarR family transcriptional regulator